MIRRIGAHPRCEEGRPRDDVARNHLAREPEGQAPHPACTGGAPETSRSATPPAQMWAPNVPSAPNARSAFRETPTVSKNCGVEFEIIISSATETLRSRGSTK